VLEAQSYQQQPGLASTKMWKGLEHRDPHIPRLSNLENCRSVAIQQDLSENNKPCSLRISLRCSPCGVGFCTVCKMLESTASKELVEFGVDVVLVTVAVVKCSDVMDVVGVNDVGDNGRFDGNLGIL
jgi:hypothetical protein